MIVTPYLIGLRPVYSISFQLWSRHENLQADMYGFKMSMRVVFLCHQVYAAGKKSRSNFMKCRTRASIFEKTGSLSNGVDDLENFTSEMEWSFFVPVGFSCVFSNWYSYISTPPAFPEVIKIPESKATAFQTLDSAVYSFNRTVGEIILDAVKNSCTMWKRSMMIRAFGNNALMNLMYRAFRSTTTDFTAALSRFVQRFMKFSLIVFVNLFSRIATMS